MDNLSPPDDEPQTDVMTPPPVAAIQAGEAQLILRQALDAASLAFDRLEALSVAIARALDGTAAHEPATGEAP